MNTAPSGHWWSQLLRRLPVPLIAALDAWSYRIAKRSAAKRRCAARLAAAKT